MRMMTTIEGTLKLASVELRTRLENAEADARHLVSAILEKSPPDKIQALEAAITPRRMREAMFGGVESGAFIAVLNNAIDDLRKAR